MGGGVGTGLILYMIFNWGTIEQTGINQCGFFFTDGCSCFPGWKGEKCNEGWYKWSEKELKEELKKNFF